MYKNRAPGPTTPRYLLRYLHPSARLTRLFGLGSYRPAYSGSLDDVCGGRVLGVRTPSEPYLYLTEAEDSGVSDMRRRQLGVIDLLLLLYPSSTSCRSVLFAALFRPPHRPAPYLNHVS